MNTKSLCKSNCIYCYLPMMIVRCAKYNCGIFVSCKKLQQRIQISIRLWSTKFKIDFEVNYKSTIFTVSIYEVEMKYSWCIGKCSINFACARLFYLLITRNDLYVVSFVVFLADSNLHWNKWKLSTIYKTQNTISAYFLQYIINMKKNCNNWSKLCIFFKM